MRYRDCLPTRVYVATFATPTHQRFLDEYFLPTFPFGPEVALEVRLWEQECGSGEYLADGWNRTMARKLGLLMEQVSQPEGTLFLHADCDVVWSGRPLTDFCSLGAGVLVGHSDGPGGLCAGVLVGRASRQMAAMVAHAADLLQQGKAIHDQHAINMAAPTYGIRLAQTFAIHSPGAIIGQQVQDIDPALLPPPPPDWFCAHANWCVGMDAKARVLEHMAQHRRVSL